MDPDKQQQLIDVLAEATDQVMSRLPGFISANVHKSLDGTKVVNYVQWRSREEFEAMQRNPEARPYMAKAASLAQFELNLYDVAFINHA